MLDSPYVRRVAITAQMLELEYVHRNWSVFRNYDDIRKVNPLVKAPTLVCDDGAVLVDSTLIIDYLESIAPKKRSLMPADPDKHRHALQLIGIALIAMEKTVQIIYETRQRPKEHQHPPWIARVEEQLASAVTMLSDQVGDGNRWLINADVTQADISVAAALRFVREIQPAAVAAKDFPGLARFSERAEDLPAFRACPFD